MSSFNTKSTTRSEAFKKAAEDVKTLKDKPSTTDSMRLYGLYKVATGWTFDSAKKPPVMDFVGNSKYQGWKEVVDEGINTPEVAQEEYVALVQQIQAANTEN